MDGHERPWIERIERIGGEPCVDFINSVSDRIGPDPVEQLRSYADLLGWLKRCKLLPAGEATTLLVASRRQPDVAQRVWRDALRLRDAAFRLLWARAHGDDTNTHDLAVLEREVKACRQHTGLASRRDHGFALVWTGRPDDPARALWRVAAALEHFLLSDDLVRLRGCAGETCGWLFVDRSRNGMRRWCSMRDCGNRAKARRHYRRASGRS